MLRKTLLLILLTFSLAAPFASFADEGMWLPDMISKLPLSQLKARGLQLTPEEIYSTTKPSLKDAIVIVGGGTGSFVSPDGLILTNHHVAFEAVTKASSTEHNYIADGFLAKNRGEELPAKGYVMQITQDFKDVTAQINAAVTPAMDDAARSRAIAQKQTELAQAAMQGREKEGVTAQVVEMFGGAQHYLYTYQTFRDVRLVYAPPKSIGYFGGDPDNFEWPRHCGDFAFMRAYAGKDGQPAEFSKENTPFKPKKFLALDASGVKEGDFAMVLGYPGTTYRYRESYSVEYHQNVRLPFFVETLQEQIDLLTAAGQRDPELKIKFADQIFSLSNTTKNFAGTLKGLRRMNLVEKKRAEEAEFTKWLNANPALKAKYGDVLPQIGAAYADLNSFNQRDNALNQILQAGDLINVIEFAYRRALDRAKPENERSPQYSDQVVQRLTAQLDEAWKERTPAVERQLLTAALARAGRLPAEQRSQNIENFFAGKTGDERRAAEAEFARRVTEESKFKSFDEVAKLFNAAAADLRASDDPALKLVSSLIDELAPLTTRTEAFNNAVIKLRPQYVRAMLEWKKGTPYPDANRTLRFTYGDIKGYRPRDAVSYDYQTSLSGVVDKDTGAEPFDVPAKLKELWAKKDYGQYVDQRLKDVPVAFLTTNDITGGNSGSALLNGKGEITGLVFDGNYEGLGSDYAFNPALSRTIAVDIRYVLFVTDKFAGASSLFNEMQIKRGKAMAASR